MIEGNSTPLGGRQSRSKEDDAGRKQREDQLDRALADTFPASDTPAQISKGTISNPTPQEKRDRKIKQYSPGKSSRS